MRDQAKEDKRYLDDNIMESYAFHRRGDWMYMHKSLIRFFHEGSGAFGSMALPNAERALAKPNLYMYFCDMTTPGFHNDVMKGGFY
jgi:hypothetical protein